MSDEQDKIDAERYRWLRSQFWNDFTLSVVRPGGLPVGTQTYSHFELDELVDSMRNAPSANEEAK